MFIHLHKAAQTGELFSKLVREVSYVHDWLVGPAMSEQAKLERDIAESEGWRRGLTGR